MFNMTPGCALVARGNIPVLETPTLSCGHHPFPGDTRPSIASQAREGLSCSALGWGRLTSNAGTALGATIAERSNSITELCQERLRLVS